MVPALTIMAEDAQRLAEELRQAQQRLGEEEFARQQQEAEAAERHQAEVDALRAVADEARAHAQAREARLAMQGRALTDEQFADDTAPRGLAEVGSPEACMDHPRGRLVKDTCVDVSLFIVSKM